MTSVTIFLAVLVATTCSAITSEEKERCPLTVEYHCYTGYEQCLRSHMLGASIARTFLILEKYALHGSRTTRRRQRHLSRTEVSVPKMLEVYLHMMDVSERNLVGSNRFELQKGYRALKNSLTLMMPAFAKNTTIFDVMDADEVHDWEVDMVGNSESRKKHRHHLLLTELETHIRQLRQIYHHDVWSDCLIGKACESTCTEAG